MSDIPLSDWRACVECAWEGPGEATTDHDEYGDGLDWACPACNYPTRPLLCEGETP